MLVVINHVIISNNMEVANLSLARQTTTTNTKLVKFNLGYQNSCKYSAIPYNLAGTWTFVLYGQIGSLVLNYVALSNCIFSL